MDLTLTDDQQSLRDLARDWVDREVVPNAAAWDREEQVDRAIVGKLAEVGFLGMGIAEEYGGSGGDFLSYVLMMEELGRGDTSIRGIVSVSLGLVSKSIQAWGTEEQKNAWLPDLCSGAGLACFGLTEPGTGSDAGSLVSRAVRDGDDWVISGNKLFITNGTWATVALVFARTGGPGARGITAFLVPTDSPGFERREIKGKLGLRGQATAELILSDVRVPDSNRLGDEGSGFKIAMTALDKGRISVAAG
ncbi:acyl-CoA dehydrogenase family protein, partial [Nocardioides sp. GCM10030258]